jgi:hypothetical protein
MKNSFRIMSVLAVSLVFFVAFITPDPPLYKNLKVLPKNTNKVQLDSIMDHFTKSLGVKCNFCHVRNEAARSFDFPNDSLEHKRITRDMMRMQTKINKNFFDIKNAKKLDAKLEVTCITCHNGKVHPVNKVPVTAVEK